MTIRESVRVTTTREGDENRNKKKEYREYLNIGLTEILTSLFSTMTTEMSVGNASERFVFFSLDNGP